LRKTWLVVFFSVPHTGRRDHVEKVMLTDSVKAPLKSVLLPVPWQWWRNHTKTTSKIMP